MIKKIRFYTNLYKTDRKAFRHQLWMVWNRHKINFIKWWFELFASISKTFYTVRARPVWSRNMNTWSDPNGSYPKTAIVMQGPLVQKHGFTLESVKLYKKHFPDSPVIVSTWKSEPKSALDALQEAGALVVTSDPPQVSGIGNINFQLVSTMAGLQKAKELGAEYVYKTRVDQRMYAPNMHAFLYSLTEIFPVREGFKQKRRLIASSFGTHKYSPYMITDVFLYGHIDDMLLYWDVVHDQRTRLETVPKTPQDVVDARINESYICSEFLKKIGRHIDWTVEDSWAAYADHFCVVDKSTLDLFFYKYNFYQEMYPERYDGIPNNAVLTFADWLVLYQTRGTKRIPPKDSLTKGRFDLLENTHTN